MAQSKLTGYHKSDHPLVVYAYTEDEAGIRTRTERVAQRENAEDDAVLIGASQVAGSARRTVARPSEAERFRREDGGRRLWPARSRNDKL